MLLNGINEIIEYGTLACINELKHYMEEDNEDDDITPHNEQSMSALKSYNLKNYKKAIDICINYFADDEGWQESYGGYAWEKIATSIKNLINLKSGLKASIQNKNFEQELAIMKDIIIELNIFDGMAHNTDSIFPKLLKLEDEKNNPTDEELLEDAKFLGKDKDEDILRGYIAKRKLDIMHRQVEDRKKIRNLMDVKELSDPVDVFREIEPTLTQSGDIGKYKDFAAKLRNNPKYHNYDDIALNIEKQRIPLRKKIKKNIHEIQDKIDELIDDDQFSTKEDDDIEVEATIANRQIFRDD